MTFEEKVRSMTGKEIVQAMIDGLSKPWVEVNMNTYGDWFFHEGKHGQLTTRKFCVGCAATNTICQIADIKFNIKNIDGLENRSKRLKTNINFLIKFEMAINGLRRGNVKEYNSYAEDIEIALLPELEKELPYLETENYKELLHYYQEYCDTL